MHEDLRDLPLDLGHDDGGVPGFQGGHVFPGIIDGYSARFKNFDWHGLRTASLRILRAICRASERPHACRQSRGQQAPCNASSITVHARLSSKVNSYSNSQERFLKTDRVGCWWQDSTNGEALAANVSVRPMKSAQTIHPKLKNSIQLLPYRLFLFVECFSS